MRSESSKLNGPAHHEIWTPEAIAKALDTKARKTNTARDRWTTKCPAHSDDSPSLDVEPGREGGVVVICRAGCQQADVIAELTKQGIALNGHTKRDRPRIGASGSITSLLRRSFKIAGEYDYTDADGVVLYQNIRLELQDRAGKRLAKSFRQRRPNPGGEWTENLDGVARVPYRLSKLVGSTGDVHVTEGEKDCNRLASLGLVATSIADPKTTELAALADRVVFVHADNDQPGRAKAQRLANALADVAARVVIVHYPDAGEKGDVSDWLDAGRGLNDLQLRLEQAKGANTTTDQAVSVSGPDMSIVQRAVAPAPALHLAAFGPLAAWIAQAAESKSSPVDYIAMALLGGIAGVVGASRWVSPWTGWREPAILWLMLVGSPSASKSPAMDAVRDPLAEVERTIAAGWPETRRAHEAAKVIAEARRENWEKEARAAVQAKRSEPAMPAEAEAPPVPEMPRIVITDATIEATASILCGNPRGVVLWRDEGSAWLGNLSKYGDGDRAFWLEANGGRSFTVDRKKLAEPQRLEYLAISIITGIQPDRLATLLMAGDDDGLAARFMLTWPESVKPKRPRHKPDSGLVTKAFRRLRLLEFRSDAESGDLKPVTLSIEPAALDVFQEWREDHHADCESASGLIASALGKMPGQALRLALVLELLWWAAGPEGVAQPDQVSARALGVALDLIETYFKPMLRRVLGEAALPQVDRHAAQLARAIQARRSTTVNAREIRRDWRLPGLREGQTVAAAIGALEEAGWLTQTGGRDGGSAGRQKANYAVDPRVHGGRP